MTNTQDLRLVCSECHSENTVKIESANARIPCTQCQADLDNPFPVEVDDESCITHIMQNDIAVLLDFYSTTCGPCMAMYEDYEDAALAFGVKVRFLKINADKYQKVAAQYGVSSLPTIIAFKKGEEVNRISKQLSQTELNIWAESLV